MSPTSLTDDELVPLAAGGDQVAFEILYERHHRAIYRYALSILHDPEDARDVLQSTMERALRSLGSQSESGGFRAWLFKIGHNEAMNALEARAPDAAAAGPALLAADAASAAANRDRMRQLVEDLGTLPERQRSALVMRELSGLDSEEIGTALSISAAAANQSVYEARVALTTMADGRDMTCERVQQRLSDGDGRRLRGRRMRAHLRDCAFCQAFSAGIGSRTVDLGVMFPPLAAAVAVKTLAAVTAGGGGVAAVTAGGASGGAQAAAAGRSILRDRGPVAAGVGLATVLVLAAILGASRGSDEPKSMNPVAGPAPRAAAPEAVPEAARKPAPEPREQAPRAPEPAPPATVLTPASVIGYSQVDPAVAQLLTTGGGGAAGADGAAGTGGAAGATAGAGSGDSLAFTGLEVLMLVSAGLGLLGLGLVMRTLGRRPGL